MILSHFAFKILEVHFFVYSFLKKSIIDFNWRLITLQYCTGFCHMLTWISHGYTYVPPPQTPLPHPIPLGCPTASAETALSHASNLDRWSLSHMVIYMFQCYSLKSCHPHLLPQSSKVRSLYLCLFCCLTYRVNHYHLSKFHIYVLIYYIGVFLSDLLLSV